ncbi:hypothetical protein CJ030_MR0G008818 [Morella rubra]|uniref:Carbohydrate kinase PfkB domain-containing protein n=1 Tax=Morella rubra TaxID=262757 RepID=A0A6A1UIA3_9ROSI|nr:hypothetical protein CJ030_MR0G008818 [Morella rubra]
MLLRGGDAWERRVLGIVLIKKEWKDGELEIELFAANQVDPTGAGDSFLSGFVAGLVRGLAVPDAGVLFDICTKVRKTLSL